MIGAARTKHQRHRNAILPVAAMYSAFSASSCKALLMQEATWDASLTLPPALFSSSCIRLRANHVCQFIACMRLIYKMQGATYKPGLLLPPAAPHAFACNQHTCYKAIARIALSARTASAAPLLQSWAPSPPLSCLLRRQDERMSGRTDPSLIWTRGKMTKQHPCTSLDVFMGENFA